MNIETPAISFDHTVFDNLRAIMQREWLVSNGIGGYAMGSVAGMRTRGYHGLLIAALKPPLGRYLLLSNLEETATYQDKPVELLTNSWHPDDANPDGYRHIDSFHLDGTTPVWVFQVGDARLEKRIWMQQGENTTYVRYTLLAASEPLTLSIKALVNYRDHHTRTTGTTLPLHTEAVEHGINVSLQDNPPFYIFSNTATVSLEHVWYENLYLPAEADRKLAAYDNNLLAGVFQATLHVGEAVDIVATTNEHASLDGLHAHQTHRIYEQSILEASPLTQAPNEIRQLTLAANQFIIHRETQDDIEGRSVIAGYPWFGDWGRDTMISLPGLMLTTGQPELAAKVLRTFANFVDQGMLPNRFPDVGEDPEYNTIDATLWYFQAIRSYHKATGDLQLLQDLFSVLTEIIDWHLKGTRHQIHVDPADQLLYGGEHGIQLTWMDAKYGDHVVTPRIGKPIEVNALWFNALKTMAEFSDHLGFADHRTQYDTQAAQVADSFQRFWNQSAGYCYDVLDGPEGHEALLRPNQLFAVSLPYSPLTETQQKSIVDTCSRTLLTPFGLRSLASDQPGYLGRYTGNTEQRDSAYHQGTVWAWLMGPFIEAHLRIYKDSARAQSFLRPLLDTHLRDYGLGSVSEIFSGDIPFVAGGCPEQAWSVAELLRVWQLANT